MRKKKRADRPDPEWEEAIRLCRLSPQDVRKAKEVGLGPRSLLKNRPSPSQPWKAPVHVWVRQLHERMLARSARKRARMESRAPGNESEPTLGHERHAGQGLDPKTRTDARAARTEPAGESSAEPDRRVEGDDDCPF
jgi:hypothetical protein